MLHFTLVLPPQVPCCFAAVCIEHSGEVGEGPRGTDYEWTDVTASVVMVVVRPDVKRKILIVCKIETHLLLI